MRTMDDAALQCRDFVKRHDLDAYLGTLLCPEVEQARLFAIWAIAVDALRLPWSASEPAMAMIRLQWWRDALEAGEGHPAFAHLAGHEAGPLIRHLDAAERLHGAPFDDADEAEAWSREAFLPLMQALAGEGEDSKAGDTASLATLHGLVLLLRRAAFPRRSGLPLLAGVRAVDEVRARAIRLAAGERFTCRIAAWLPFALSRRWGRKMQGMQAEELLKHAPEFPQWRRQLHLLKCRLMRRF